MCLSACRAHVNIFARLRSRAGSVHVIALISLDIMTPNKYPKHVNIKQINCGISTTRTPSTISILTHISYVVANPQNNIFRNIYHMMH